jgi:hypothetical protein
MTRAREAARLIGNNTFRLDSNNAVGFNSTTPDAMFDINHGLTVAGVSTFTGNVTMSGDLTVQGTTTTLDTIVQEVDLMNIQANSSTAGLGVTQSGSGDIIAAYDGTTKVWSIADGGAVSMTANLDLQDNDRIRIGASQDLQIYHDASNSYIIEEGTGSLRIDSNQLELRNADTDNVLLDTTSAGAVRVRYNGSTKLETTSDGATLTGRLSPAANDTYGLGQSSLRWANLFLSGDLDMSDGDNILLGADDDLKLFHDGSNSLVENYNGGLFIDQHANDGDINLRTDNGSGNITYYVVCDGSAGSVILYHYGSTKLETTSTGVTVTGDVNSTSDINLKKDIEVVTNATEMLNQLRGVKFTWKENDEKSVGVIAQEVEAILPELVKGEEGDKSVNYSGLVGVLIEAVKELSARVEELENK